MGAGREWTAARWIEWVRFRAVRPRNAELSFHSSIVGLQIRVADRPVGRHTVAAVCPKIRFVKTRRDADVAQRRSTDALHAIEQKLARTNSVKVSSRIRGLEDICGLDLEILKIGV